MATERIDRATGTARPVELAPAGGLGEAKLGRILGYQLAQAAIVSYAVFEQEVGRPLQLRPVEYTILCLVTENPGVSTAQLSDALAVPRASITSLIDKLEARSLVTRAQSVLDRPGQQFQATPRGAALAGDATQRLIVAERKAFSTLSADEQANLTALLHKLAAARNAPPAEPGTVEAKSAGRHAGG